MQFITIIRQKAGLINFIDTKTHCLDNQYTINFYPNLHFLFHYKNSSNGSIMRYYPFLRDNFFSLIESLKDNDDVKIVLINGNNSKRNEELFWLLTPFLFWLLFSFVNIFIIC